MLGIIAVIALGVLTVGSYDVLNEPEQPDALEQDDLKVSQVFHQQKEDQHPTLMRDYNL